MLTPKYFADSTISQDVSLDGIGMLYQQLSLVAYLKDLAFLGDPMSKSYSHSWMASPGKSRTEEPFFCIGKIINI